MIPGGMTGQGLKRRWILDRDDTPQGFPLGQLVAKLREIAALGTEPFFVRRARGYGPEVTRLEAALDRVEEVVLSADEMTRLSIGLEEWFYELEVRCATRSGTVFFGVHDSTAMFLDAPPETAGRILDGFRDVRDGELPSRVLDRRGPGGSAESR